MPSASHHFKPNKFCAIWCTLIATILVMLGLSAWALVIAYQASTTLTTNVVAIGDGFCAGDDCNKYIIINAPKAESIGDDMCVGGCNSLT